MPSQQQSPLQKSLAQLQLHQELQKLNATIEAATKAQALIDSASAQIKKQQQDAERALSDAKQETERIKYRNTQAQQEANSALSAVRDELRREEDALRSFKGNAKVIRTSLHRQTTRAQEDDEAARVELAELRGELTEMNKQVTEAQQMLQATEMDIFERVESSNAQVGDAERMLHGLLQDIEMSQKTLKSLQDAVTNTTKQHREVETMLVAAQKAAEETMSSLNNREQLVRDEISELESKQEELQQNMFTLNSQLTARQREIEKKEELVQQHEEEIVRLKKRYKSERSLL